MIKKTLLESQQFFQSIKNIYKETQVWNDYFFEMFLASEFRNAGGVFRNHRGFAGGGVGFAKWKNIGSFLRFVGIWKISGYIRKSG